MNEKKWKKLKKGSYKIEKEDINKKNGTVDTFLGGGLFGLTIGLLFILIVSVILEEVWVIISFIVIWLIYLLVSILILFKKEKVIYVKEKN